MNKTVDSDRCTHCTIEGAVGYPSLGCPNASPIEGGSGYIISDNSTAVDRLDRLTAFCVALASPGGLCQNVCK